ncbi:MAG: DUF433 domain-containing protein [Oscillatoria sp. PMC 1068.18]|nr:DUF433 domain-containing protein [Oscillatoria sp. PMC 1076.18]MEC4990706.1 DUF433 domain-containing protein [Oscillatoria sp. PMC 1068.18]
MIQKELASQLLSLTPAQKAEVTQLLSTNLPKIGQGIRKTPGVMGGDACIRETRIPVWLLVNFRRLGVQEAKLLENYPSLAAEDLVNAWNYAEAYQEEIETAIKKHEETYFFP